MSPGNSYNAPGLSLDARKRLLLVACTIDRINLLAKTTAPAQPASLLAQLGSPAWMDTLASVAMRLLPRELRILSSLWKIWRTGQKR